MPAPTVLVAAAIAVTVILLRREPAAAQYLPPPAVYLAAVLTGCLWVAVSSPRWLGTTRLAAHLGAAAAVVFAAWFWLAIHSDEMEPPLPLVLLLAPVLVLAPVAVTRSTAGCSSTARWWPPSARTWPMPWPSASASLPCSASPSR